MTPAPIYSLLGGKWILLNHRFISLVPPCYIIPRELYPLPKTKCVVPTQISILFQWQLLLQLSPPYLVSCWTCSCLGYNWDTALWGTTINHHISFLPSIYRTSAYIPLRKTKFSIFVGSNWPNNRIIRDTICVTGFSNKAIQVLRCFLNLDRRLCA
jgi:hypothetical protein